MLYIYKLFQSSQQTYEESTIIIFFFTDKKEMEAWRDEIPC